MLTDEKIFHQAKSHHFCEQIRQPLYLLQDNNRLSITAVSEGALQDLKKAGQDYTLIGALPALYPERLGSSLFLKTHGSRFPYVVGEMANGIATANMVIAAAQAGCVGFFGAAGLSANKVADNIRYIQSQLRPDQINWGSNLIHAPYESALEAHITQLYLDLKVRRVSASAYMQINPNIVYYACKGLQQNPQGQISRLNHVFAKVSRIEVAKQFMEPPPEAILQHLLASGKITVEEARLAKHIPIAQDITVESDSGGHTDNRPLLSLFSSIQLLENHIREKHGYLAPIRLGAAGGIGTPSAAAGAFSLGADYILTGSINQSAIESGLSEQAKNLLAQADIADVAMAPAADMFELGVNVQVLKRGTLFPGRAKKLFELYRTYSSIHEIPAEEKEKLEKTIFKMPIEEVWKQTHEFFEARNPSELEKAQKNAKHQMALIFRWYLGLSSAWSISGDTQRLSDYQIWCGPAMGAFNHWVKGTFLEPIQNRSVVQIALNILEGAATITRAQQLRSYHVDMPFDAFRFQPRLLG
jgi:trans-AT polyketide synthase, acyltransferase and oxidoreductase domains